MLGVWGKRVKSGEAMGYGEMYGALLKAIAEEADAIAMRYFRTGDLRIDRKGDGADGDGGRLRVTGVSSLSKPMVFTTGTGPSKNAEDQTRIRRLLDASRNTRSFGGFWQHMLVAEGAIEAALDWTSKPWDLAPLGIIVEEAGGRSTDLRGGRTIYSGQLLSTNGKIHDEVLKLLA